MKHMNPAVPLAACALAASLLLPLPAAAEVALDTYICAGRNETSPACRRYGSLSRYFETYEGRGKMAAAVLGEVGRSTRNRRIARRCYELLGRKDFIAHLAMTMEQDGAAESDPGFLDYLSDYLTAAFKSGVKMMGDSGAKNFLRLQIFTLENLPNDTCTSPEGTGKIYFKDALINKNGEVTPGSADEFLQFYVRAIRTGAGLDAPSGTPAKPATEDEYKRVFMAYFTIAVASLPAEQGQKVHKALIAPKESDGRTVCLAWKTLLKAHLSMPGEGGAAARAFYIAKALKD